MTRTWIGAGRTFVARALCASAILATVCFAATATNAETTRGFGVGYADDNSASLRIDISGKLRMLGQRAVAAACYMNADVDIEQSKTMLVTTVADFAQITAALEFGDIDLGVMGEETDPKILATLERLSALWGPIAETADKVLTGEATEAELTQMALQSEPLLEMAQRLVAAVTAEYSLGATLVMRDALAIDIAGRQRMLAQRISKDVCLLATGINAEHSRDDLAQTAEIFETSLFALRSGMPSAGLIATTDEQVLTDLDVATADWNTIQPKIADALSGGLIDNERLAIMRELANKLTTDMNNVVIHYKEASKVDL